MKITFIQTGGTIDKDYPRQKGGWAFEIDAPASRRILTKLHPSFDYEHVTLLKKDSLEITQEDRKMIRQYISTHENSKFILTHGTDTMIETAKSLAGIPDKTIVLTGAMRPERFANSDAPINLGVAIGAINLLEEGVYIAMHGKVLEAAQVTRDSHSGQYQQI